MTSPPTSAQRLPVNLGSGHEVTDGVENEQGHWDELSIHRDTRLKKWVHFSMRVCLGDFSVKNLSMSSSWEELQVC